MIRELLPRDWPEWRRMRETLWPDCVAEMHALEMKEQSAGVDVAVLVFQRPNSLLGAFIELSIRDRVDGSLSSRVGYVEGWYVDADLRGVGIGRQLIERASEWARHRGLEELASDAELADEDSIRAHRALGFRETFRLVHFVRSVRN